MVSRSRIGLGLCVLALLAWAAASYAVELTLLGAVSTGDPNNSDVAISPSGTVIATSSTGSDLRIWDATDPTTISLAATISFPGSLARATYSPDGTFVATGGSNQTVYFVDVTDIANPVEMASAVHGHSISGIAISSDQSLMAVSGDGNTAELWDISSLASPVSLGEAVGHLGRVGSVAFSADGTMLATGSADLAVRLWDITTPASPAAITVVGSAHTNHIPSLGFSPDGSALVSASADGTAKAWDLAGEYPPALMAELSGVGEGYAVMSASGARLFTSGAQAQVWDISSPATPTLLAATSEFSTAATRVHVSADATKLAALGDGTAVRLYGVISDGVAAASPDPLGVGVVDVGSTGTGILTISNTGAAPLSVTDVVSSNTQFSASPTAFSVDAGSSQDVVVTFAPSVVGLETADIAFIHNGSGSDTAVASGIGRITPPTGDLNDTRIAYQTDIDGNDEIYIVTVDGAVNTNLTQHPSSDTVPTWSPDVRRVAFASNRDGDYEIYVIDTDGSNLVQLTDNEFVDGEPAWSPDGLSIAFSSDRDGDREIYVMGADGSAPTRLTNEVGSDNFPAWSPDGSKLMFQSERGPDPFATWVMRADGSDPTFAFPSISGPGSWSPDGTRFALYFQTGAYFEVITVGVDRSDEVRYGIPGSTWDPSWSPDGARFVLQRAAGEIITRVSEDPVGATVDITSGGSNSSATWSQFGEPGAFGAARVTAGSWQSQAGTSFTIPVDISDVTGLDLVGASLVLTYDPTLLTPRDDGLNTTAVSLGDVVAASADPSSWSVAQNVSAPGTLDIALAGSISSPAVGGGTLVTVVFEVDSSAASGDASALDLVSVELSEGLIPATVVNGAFTVLDLVFGDVTGNGTASPLDAAWILEYAAGNLLVPPVVTRFPIQDTAPTWAPAPVTDAVALNVADTDNDLELDPTNGTVSSNDASLILQRVVKLITVFPAEQPASAPSLASVSMPSGLTGSASSLRPGDAVTVWLRMEDLSDIYAGELRFDYDAELLIPADIQPTADGEAAFRSLSKPGQLALTFASGRPLANASSMLSATFHVARGLERSAATAVTVSRVRLNGRAFGDSLTHPLNIQPYQFLLGANYPNPFNPETWIPFELAEDADVTVHIYGLGGKIVRTLDVGYRPKGEYRSRGHAAYWDGRNEVGERVASGAYIYELLAGSQRATRRMVIAK